jgi:hypothetical protein
MKQIITDLNLSDPLNQCAILLLIIQNQHKLPFQIFLFKNFKNPIRTFDMFPHTWHIENVALTQIRNLAF